VRGFEKLPKSGPYIISSNHQSYLDPLILAGVLPPEIFDQVFAVGTSEIFGKGLMRGWRVRCALVVVDPDANLIPAMRAGAFGLRQGLSLILYPEGERSIDGRPRIFKKGAAILSIHLQVPIVPVAIEGFYKAWPRNKAFQGFNPLEDGVRRPDHSATGIRGVGSGLRKADCGPESSRCVEMWEELFPCHLTLCRRAAAFP
jgi:long-chain acyl-CoA synthetase